MKQLLLFISLCIFINSSWAGNQEVQGKVSRLKTWQSGVAILQLDTALINPANCLETKWYSVQTLGPNTYANRVTISLTEILLKAFETDLTVILTVSENKCYQPSPYNPYAYPVVTSVEIVK